MRICIFQIGIIFASVLYHTYALQAQPVESLQSIMLLLHAPPNHTEANEQNLELELKFDNDEFLLDPESPIPKSYSVDPTILSVIASDNLIRIEGYSYPLVYVKNQGPYFKGKDLMFFAERQARAVGWQDALANRFYRPMNIPNRQQYVLIANDQTLTQLWLKDDSSYPKAVMLPTKDVFDRRLPVEYLLVALMTRPNYLLNKVWQLVAEKSFREKACLDDHSFRIFEENVPETADILQPVIVFLDTQRNCAVARLIIPSTNEFRQYDIMYEESVEKSSLPTRCSVYVGATNGDVLGYAEIERRKSQNITSVPSSVFDVNWEDGTYLVDFTAGSEDAEQLLVKSDAQRVVINRSLLIKPDVTYESLIVADHTIESDKPWELHQYRSRRSWLTSYLRWPWNLITVTALVVGGIVVRLGLKLMQKRRAFAHPDNSATGDEDRELL